MEINDAEIEKTRLEQIKTLAQLKNSILKKKLDYYRNQFKNLNSRSY